MKTRNHATGVLLILFAAGCSGAVTSNDRTPAPVGGQAGQSNQAGNQGGNGSGGRSGPGSGTGGQSAGGNSGGGSGAMGQGGNSGASPDAAPSLPASDARPAGPGPSGPGLPVPPSMPAGPPGPWARGVTLGLVEVTQGVFVKIGEGGMVVAPAMRNAPLIEGRPIYVRVHVTTGAGFAAKRLRGVLTWDPGDGTSKGLEDARMITGSSNPERVDTTFNFVVPATDVLPKAAMWIALYEAGAGEGADPATLPRFPATGTVDLAVKAGRMELDVVALPVTGAMGALLDTPERRKKLENDLYDQYPVQKVNLRIREPLNAAMTKLANSGAGFTALRNARMADNAKAWEYYHLLVSRADINFGALGVASIAGTGANDGPRRVGITVVGGRAVDGNTNTAAHEIGHNHGRPHSPGCSLAAGGNNMYPYPQAGMGVNGFSLSTMTLKSKTIWKDLMGYCRAPNPNEPDRWVSDYTWNQLEARVRAVTALSTGAPPTALALEEFSLQAFVGPGEKPSFGLASGRLVEGSAPASGQARLRLTDGRELMVPVAVGTLTDDSTREIALSLPAGEEVESAVVEVDGQKIDVDVAGLLVQ